MAQLILHSVKRVLYKNGSYACPNPKANTSEWTVNDWINYIDEKGAWVV